MKRRLRRSRPEPWAEGYCHFVAGIHPKSTQLGSLSIGHVSCWVEKLDRHESRITIRDRGRGWSLRLQRRPAATLTRRYASA